MNIILEMFDMFGPFLKILVILWSVLIVFALGKRIVFGKSTYSGGSSSKDFTSVAMFSTFSGSDGD